MESRYYKITDTINNKLIDFGFEKHIDNNSIIIFINNDNTINIIISYNFSGLIYFKLIHKNHIIKNVIMEDVISTSSIPSGDETYSIINSFDTWFDNIKTLDIFKNIMRTRKIQKILN